jgi:transposase-like protein
VTLTCKKCGGEKHVKAGFIEGEQRYLCGNCGCKFVPTRQRGKSEKDKLLAIWLYMHGLSYRAIAKLLRVTHKSIYDWVKALADTNYIKPEPQGNAVVVGLDKMWHFLHSNENDLGYGKLVVVIPVNLLTGNTEGATMLHFQGFASE